MTIVRAATPADRVALGRMGAALARLHHQWAALGFRPTLLEMTREA